MKRYGYSYRKVNHTIAGNHNSAMDAWDKMDSFRSFVDRQRTEYTITQDAIWNMDYTPVWLHALDTLRTLQVVTYLKHVTIHIAIQECKDGDLYET
jgi:hypothetical protein